MHGVWRLVVLGVLIAACGGAGARGGERRSSQTITNEELRASQAGSVYELVQSIRPGWLRVRGATSLRETGAVIVYVNSVKSGGVDVLRQIRPDAVEALRYLNEVAATARYGPGHAYGVIEVTLIAGH